MNFYKKNIKFTDIEFDEKYQEIMKEHIRLDNISYNLILVDENYKKEKTNDKSSTLSTYMKILSKTNPELEYSLNALLKHIENK